MKVRGLVIGLLVVLVALWQGDVAPYAADATPTAHTPAAHQSSSHDSAATQLVALETSGVINAPAGLPRIGLSPAALHFEAPRGGGFPPAQVFTITNTSAVGILDWLLTPEQFWIGSAPLAGRSNEATVQVWVTTTDLSLGPHWARLHVLSNNAINSPESVVVTLEITCPVQMPGDVNVDGAISQADVVYLLNFVTRGGDPPQPILEAGDVNCSQDITMADVIYLLNHVVKSGPPPCDICLLL